MHKKRQPRGLVRKSWKLGNRYIFAHMFFLYTILMFAIILTLILLQQLREDRRREVAEHVETVNRLLRESGAVSAQLDDEAESAEEEGEWDGFPDKPDLDIVDHEEEYIDEDRYTTVKVESVSVSRDGFSKPNQSDDEAEEEARRKREEAEKNEAEAKHNKPSWQKKKKKKFRYESKIERQLTERKQKAKSRPRKD